MTCKHVYEIIGVDLCPACGRDTHETNQALARQLFNEHYEQGRHLAYKCPVEGGTIRGWWSI
jgi:hypothetical protein